MNKRILVLSLLLIGFVYLCVRDLSAPAETAAQSIPAPEDVLGFKPGDDRKLASWNQVVEYFDRLDRASDRIKVETLGKSTMDKPFVMATISAPENLARLEEYKAIQDQLADPRTLGTGAYRDRKAAELIRRGKTIVLITCGIHSTEVGSYLSSMKRTSYLKVIAGSRNRLLDQVVTMSTHLRSRRSLFRRLTKRLNGPRVK